MVVSYSILAQLNSVTFERSVQDQFSKTNFGRVRDQPGSPASIPALFQRFGCM